MYSVLLLETPVFLISFLDSYNNFLGSNVLSSPEIIKRGFFIVFAALAEICWLIVTSHQFGTDFTLPIPIKTRPV